MFGDKLKKFFNKNTDEKESSVEEVNNKRKIENLIFFLVLLIITVVIINIILNDKKTKTKQENDISTKQLATTQIEANIEENMPTNISTINTGDELEQKLENILSKIQGVGKVEVFINYSESSEIIAMYNENSKVSTTEEADTSGGTRKIQETDSQKDIIYKEEGGEKIPITQKILQPKVEGAIITAKGASDVNIKTNIIQAVEAVTGLATHKIQVFEMN